MDLNSVYIFLYDLKYSGQLLESFDFSIFRNFSDPIYL